MKAVWSNKKKTYEIEMSEKELGVLIFGLTVARYETKDAGVAVLQEEFLDLNNS